MEKYISSKLEVCLPPVDRARKPIAVLGPMTKKMMAAAEREIAAMKDRLLVDAFGPDGTFR